MNCDFYLYFRKQKQNICLMFYCDPGTIEFFRALLWKWKSVDNFKNMKDPPWNKIVNFQFLHICIQFITVYNHS